MKRDRMITTTVVMLKRKDTRNSARENIARS